MQILAIAIIATVMQIYSFSDRPPPVDFENPSDYIAWYNEVVTRDRTDNARTDYMKLLSADGDSLVLTPPGDDGEKQVNSHCERLWNRIESPQLADFIAAQNLHFKNFEAAAAHKYYYAKCPADIVRLFQLTMPELSAARKMMKLTWCRAHLKQPKQSEVLLNALAVSIRAGRHFQGGGFLISHLVGLASRSFCYSVLRRDLMNGVLPAGAAMRAFELLQREDRGDAGFTLVVQVEWACMLDILSYSCPRGRIDREKWAAIAGTVGTESRLKRFDPIKTAELLDNHYQRFLEIASGPLSEKKAAMLRHFENEQKQNSDWSNNTFVKTVVATFSRAYELNVRTETERRGTMLVLAIHAQRR